MACARVVSGLGDTLRPVTGPGQVASVRVPVCGLWLTPSSPRPIDAAMLVDDPDYDGWLRAMDAAIDPMGGRIGLEGRMSSQVLAGELVRTHEHAGDWVFVTCSQQPSHKNPWGYPGYLRIAHLDLLDLPVDADEPMSAPLLIARSTFMQQIRGHIGEPYLVGGLSETGLDGAGLVHLSLRELGIRYPRDCADQQQATDACPQGQERPGDLMFFARPGCAPHHVGVVTDSVDSQHIVHVLEGGRVLEEPVPAQLQQQKRTIGRIRVLR